MAERKVDMVRLARPEEFYDREEIFGRDVTSVFPKQAEASTSAAGAAQAEAFKEALGARKFISESELESIKASRGATVEDGTAAPMRPLVEVLREAKEKKQQDFQDKWKQMKTGKNRPLDPEELAFMDQLLQSQADKEREQRLHEQQELEEFRKALQEANEPEPASSAPAPAHPKPKDVSVKPAPKPVMAGIKVKPKAAGSSRSQHQPAAKKAKVEEPQPAKPVQQAEAAAAAGKQEDADEEEGLAGLLGGYGSDTDD